MQDDDAVVKELHFPLVVLCAQRAGQRLITLRTAGEVHIADFTVSAQTIDLAVVQDLRLGFFQPEQGIRFRLSGGKIGDIIVPIQRSILHRNGLYRNLLRLFQGQKQLRRTVPELIDLAAVGAGCIQSLIAIENAAGNPADQLLGPLFLLDIAIHAAGGVHKVDAVFRIRQVTVFLHYIEILMPFACIIGTPLLPIEIWLRHKTAVKSAALVHQSIGSGGKIIIIESLQLRLRVRDSAVPDII